MSALRKSTRQKIDALHAQIAELIEADKRAWETKNPGAHGIHRQIAHCQIEFARHAPETRKTFVQEGGSGYEHNYD